MKKAFWISVIFLISVSAIAQEGETKPSNDTKAQAPSKELPAKSAADKSPAPAPSSKEIVSADSAADKSLDSLSQTDSVKQTLSKEIVTDDSIADESLDSLSQIDSTELDDADDMDSALALKISTEPTEARLKIGDRDYGLTPVTITDLDVGEYVLELSKGGHFRRKVTIQLDSTGAELHFELVRPVSLFVTSEPDSAHIDFGEKYSGTTPFQSERMRPGDYPLTASIYGYELYETTVSLKSGANDTLHIILEPKESEPAITESPTAKVQEEKLSVGREVARMGIVTVAFFVFIAIFIGVEKISY